MTAQLYLEVCNDSPVLDCGDSYSDLKDEVRSWISKNIPGTLFGIDNNGYYLLFKTEQDQMNFALVWL